MDAKLFLEVMGQLDSAYYEEAAAYCPPRRRRAVKWVLLAACICLLLGSLQTWRFAGFTTLTSGVMAPLEWLIVGAGCAVVLIIEILCERGIDVCGRLARARCIVRWPALLALLLCIAVFGMYGAGYDGAAFLYTQF